MATDLDIPDQSVILWRLPQYSLIRATWIFGDLRPWGIECSAQGSLQVLPGARWTFWHLTGSGEDQEVGEGCSWVSRARRKFPPRLASCTRRISPWKKNKQFILVFCVWNYVLWNLGKTGVWNAVWCQAAATSGKQRVTEFYCRKDQEYFLKDVRNGLDARKMSQERMLDIQSKGS